MKSYTVFEAVGGSHAAGLATATSDVDTYRVVVHEPTFYLGAVNYSDKPKQTMDQMDELKSDDTVYELRHFMAQCMKGNPTTLRLLWSPEYKVFSRVAPRLLAGRQLFMTRAVYKPFRGAAQGYMNRAVDGVPHDNGKLLEPFPTREQGKQASNALQLLYQLDEMLCLYNLPVRLLDGTVYWLQRLREGRRNWDAVLNEYNNMATVVDKSLASCTLPESPDVDAVNDLTANLVYEAWSEMGVHPGGF